MIGRTSAYALAVTCSGAGQAAKSAGDLGRAVETVAFHDPVAGKHLLSLGVRAVCHERHAVLRAKASGVHRCGKCPGLDQLAGLNKLGVEGLHEGAHCRELL
jgi:hypothetical protein